MLCMITLIFLSACAKQASTDIVFDTYQMTWFLEDKIYHQKPIANSGENITIYQAQQDGTGVANSLVINKLPMMSGVSLQEVVAVNAQQLKETLQQYKLISSKMQKVPCKGNELSWYYTNFEYALDEKQTFSVGQYFFASYDMLYLISFHSTNKKDISAFVKSVKTITCK